MLKFSGFSAAAFVIFFCLVLSVSVRAEETGVIGTVMEVEGVATINGGVAEVQAPVHLNDMIETGPASRMFVLFLDDTEMTLSENTQLRVDQYVFDPADSSENKGVYSILKGVFLYTSGLIAKRPDPDVTINTPVGSIGIRGTELWGGDIDGEYGVLVNEGRVNVRTDAGEETLEKGQGTSVRGRGFRPAAAKIWAKEKIDRVGKTVFLQRREMVRKRIAEHRPRQQELRRQFKEKLRMRRQEPSEQQQKTPGLQQKAPELQHNQKGQPGKIEPRRDRALQKMQDRRDDRPHTQPKQAPRRSYQRP